MGRRLPGLPRGAGPARRASGLSAPPASTAPATTTPPGHLRQAARHGTGRGRADSRRWTRQPRGRTEGPSRRSRNDNPYCLLCQGGSDHRAPPGRAGTGKAGPVPAQQ